jgi:hypothetical protein
MADFPGSKHTFATFTNGAASDAAQVTDIYAEVEAIEDGYLNGSARLNSSNSTLANLSVTGGSTFAGNASIGGNLSVTGTSTFNGAVTFNAKPVFVPPDAARVALLSTVSIGDGVTANLNWATGDYITNSSMFTNGSSFIAPQSTGVYQVTAQVAFAVNSSGDRMVSLLDSSNAVFARNQVKACAHSASPTVITAIGTKRFDAVGGSVKVSVYQASASTMSVVIQDSFFEMRKL